MERRAGHLTTLRRSGTAMTEFALALPLLVVILALVWFVGWGHMRKQRVLVAARHVVDMEVEGIALEDHEIRDALLNRAPRRVTQRQRDDAGELLEWVDAAQRYGPAPGRLAYRTMIQQWPGNPGVRLDVEYDPPLPIGEGFDNTLVVAQRRAGLPWVRGQADQAAAIAELYLADLEAQARIVEGPGAELAERIQSLYRRPW